ncbi:MAG: glycine/betaine ABC transporter substrate-binding protein [Actinobacteria bacterium]|nr:glycine/betaine ABC transporter substrate-binding protein [Actinomycetota bacterium]
MRRPRIAVLGAALIALLLLFSACGSGEDDGDNGDAGGEPRGSITVGSDAFPEAQILGEMYALLLEDAGYTVERQLNLDSREVRLDAMESGDVDVAPEYLASLLSVLDPEADLSGDAAAVAGLLEPLLAEQNLQLLDFSDAIDTNAFVVSQEVADEYGLVTMSDLGEVASELVLGAPAECPERPFCLPGLDETYGAVFADFKPLEYGAATAQALSAGAIDVALLFSTDPLIEANDFVLLEDDKGLQSADNITPLAVADVADDVSDILNPLSGTITTDEMTALNASVAIDAEDPADVAREYLEEKGLL